MKKLFLVTTAVLNLTVEQGQAQITFQTTYGGTKFEECNSVRQTSDGGFIIAGYTRSFGAGNQDFYLVKSAQDGTIQWTKTYGGTSDEVAYSVQQTADGGYITTGYACGFGTGFCDVYLVKSASDGALQWSKTFGGSGSDGGYSVQETNDGGFIISGSFSFGAGYNDVYLVKTASDGTLQWTKTYGGTDDVGNSVQQTNDGGFIIAGFTRSFGAGYFDVYLVKTTSDGTLQWTKTFGGTGLDVGYSVRQTNDGGYIIAGDTRSFGAGNCNAYLVKTASNGTIQWTKTFGGTGCEVGNSVQQTNDGGFIITGNSNSFGDDGVYLVKTASDGTLQWTKNFGGSGAEWGKSVQQTNDGGFIIGGYTTSFGVGDVEVYLIKTDSNGDSGCNESSPISSENSGGIEGTGGQQGTAGITSSPTPQIGSGGVITSLCSTAGINETTLEHLLSIFPNPFSTQTVLQTDNLLHNATLTVDNCFGQTVAQIKNLHGQTITFNRDNLASGLYFLRLTQDNKVTATDKLVIADK